MIFRRLRLLKIAGLGEIRKELNLGFVNGMRRFRSPGIYVVEHDTAEENVVEVVDGEDEVIMRMTVGELRNFVHAEVVRLMGH
jgi:hypothetical protein